MAWKPFIDDLLTYLNWRRDGLLLIDEWSAASWKTAHISHNQPETDFYNAETH